MYDSAHSALLLLRERVDKLTTANIQRHGIPPRYHDYWDAVRADMNAMSGSWVSELMREYDNGCTDATAIVSAENAAQEIVKRHERILIDSIGVPKGS